MQIDNGFDPPLVFPDRALYLREVIFMPQADIMQRYEGKKIMRWSDVLGGGI